MQRKVCLGQLKDTGGSRPDKLTSVQWERSTTSYLRHFPEQQTYQHHIFIPIPAYRKWRVEYGLLAWKSEKTDSMCQSMAHALDLWKLFLLYTQ
jgi:hypothetical protein